MTIEDKIKQFKAEVGSRALTPEQGKLYYAFTKKNGKDVKINVVDSYGVALRVTVESSKEVRKILTKHYRTGNGTVTAMQILNMFDTVRSGEKYSSQGNTVYRKTRSKDGVTYHTVVKIFSNGHDAVLKSFYSTIGYK